MNSMFDLPFRYREVMPLVSITIFIATYFALKKNRWKYKAILFYITNLVMISNYAICAIGSIISDPYKDYERQDLPFFKIEGFLINSTYIFNTLFLIFLIIIGILLIQDDKNNKYLKIFFPLNLISVCVYLFFFSVLMSI